jgi:hypothetical protein
LWALIDRTLIKIVMFIFDLQMKNVEISEGLDRLDRLDHWAPSVPSVPSVPERKASGPSDPSVPDHLGVVKRPGFPPQ